VFLAMEAVGRPDAAAASARIVNAGAVERRDPWCQRRGDVQVMTYMLDQQKKTGFRAKARYGRPFGC